MERVCDTIGRMSGRQLVQFWYPIKLRDTGLAVSCTQIFIQLFVEILQLYSEDNNCG